MPTRPTDVDYEGLLVGVQVLQVWNGFGEVSGFDDAIEARWMSAQVRPKVLLLAQVVDGSTVAKDYVPNIAKIWVVRFERPLDVSLVSGYSFKIPCSTL